MTATFSDVLDHETKLADLVENLTGRGAIGLMYEVRMKYSQLQVELLSRFAARHGTVISLLFTAEILKDELTEGEAELLKLMEGVLEHYRTMAKDDGLERMLRDLGLSILPRSVE